MKMTKIFLYETENPTSMIMTETLRNPEFCSVCPQILCWYANWKKRKYNTEQTLLVELKKKQLVQHTFIVRVHACTHVFIVKLSRFNN